MIALTPQNIVSGVLLDQIGLFEATKGCHSSHQKFSEQDQ
jgi:hypothetical protein